MSGLVGLLLGLSYWGLRFVVYGFIRQYERMGMLRGRFGMVGREIGIGFGIWD